MDSTVLSFIDSKAIREHIKSTGYVFTPAAVRSGTITSMLFTLIPAMRATLTRSNTELNILPPHLMRTADMKCGTLCLTILTAISRTGRCTLMPRSI